MGDIAIFSQQNPKVYKPSLYDTKNNSSYTNLWPANPLILFFEETRYDSTYSYWQNIWIHYYYMSHMNPLDYLTRHESTYTAWQDMNPLTVIDMTCESICLTRNINPFILHEKAFESNCRAWLIYESTYTAWQDTNPLILLDKSYEFTYTTWQDIWIHLDCLTRHMNPT